MLKSVFRDGLMRGKVCLVTGGGSGIGLAIAAELTQLGATVVIASRKVERLKEASTKIQKLVGGAAAAPHVLEMNIRDEVAVAAAVKSVIAAHGRIDCLVNNGGGQFASPAEDIRAKGWRAVIDTNLNGTWHVTRSVYDATPPGQRSGLAIVNIIADYFNGFPGMAHTGAARAGVDNLTKTLAREWGPEGVRVNSVAPGIIASSGFDNYPEELLPEMLKAGASTPSGRCGTESETAAAVVFLLTPAASYINGATLRVDGGGSLQKANFFVADKPPAPPQPFHLTDTMGSDFNARTASKPESKL